MYFKVYDEEYNPKRKLVKKVMKQEADLKEYVNSDGGLLVLEEELKRYWDWGGGIDKVVSVGEMNDKYFQPTLSEPDFVDNQIKSKKNGDVLGYQG